MFISILVEYYNHPLQSTQQPLCRLWWGSAARPARQVPERVQAKLSQVTHHNDLVRDAEAYNVDQRKII